jgi:Asp-tRNA(Asn)/Glu-tRNA(Gln) amidotransferase A subunit family amidase
VTPLTDLGVVEAVEAIRRGETTASALLAACLARIAATDAALQAWVTVDVDAAVAEARARDVDAAAGRPLGPLHGVPIGIKDIIDVAGMPTTSGAPAFAHTHPTRDATLVAWLRAAGAVIVGKTVPTQFAYKDPAPTRNPWSFEHTPGGSSSGSAAAVAARQVPAAIGTQTVGSILRPAAFCGVVGLKGPHGAVPVDGILPLAGSFDHPGPIARSVADAALIEGVLIGVPMTLAPPHAPRLGVSAELLDRAEPPLRRHLDGVIGGLADAGATLVAVEMPGSVAGLVAAGRVILEVEAAAVHETMFSAHAGDYAPGIAELIRTGLGRSASELVEAERVRAAFRAAVEPVLDACDAMLSPTAPGSAPLRREGTGDFWLCAPWSFIGVPSITIPTGVDEAGLPLAVQLVGGPGDLGRLLTAAAWCERVIEFRERPPLGPLD